MVMGALEYERDLARPRAVRDLLARHGHRLGKSLGQHLLVDRRVLERIVGVAAISSADVILEVGPGIGTLTRELARLAARVVAVEADRRLAPVLEETLGDLANVRVVFADALRIEPSALGEPPPEVWVSNLPYNVAATLVLGLLDRIPSLMRGAVMVQREVAERMTAAPGSKAYGAYTVKLAFRVRVRSAFGVGPKAFFPPPRVDSAVVVFQRVQPPQPGQPPLAVLDTVADAAFAQRRKMLRSALASGLGADRLSVEKALSAVGIAPTVRAENLTVWDFIRLSRECVRTALVSLRS